MAARLCCTASAPLPPLALRRVRVGVGVEAEAALARARPPRPLAGLTAGVAAELVSEGSGPHTALTADTAGEAQAYMFLHSRATSARSTQAVLGGE